MRENESFLPTEKKKFKIIQFTVRKVEFGVASQID